MGLSRSKGHVVQVTHFHVWNRTHCAFNINSSGTPHSTSRATAVLFFVFRTLWFAWIQLYTSTALATYIGFVFTRTTLIVPSHLEQLFAVFFFEQQ